MDRAIGPPTFTMLLFELFPDDGNPDLDADKPAEGEMTQHLRQSALDLITPMLGHSVPFVTVKQVIDGLSRARFGIVITPSIVMDLLNPDEVKAVSKIEGDRIYLQQPGGEQQKVKADQQQQDQAHGADMAADQLNQQQQTQDEVADKATDQLSQTLNRNNAHV